jgi:hypothetical protein
MKPGLLLTEEQLTILERLGCLKEYTDVKTEMPKITPALQFILTRHFCFSKRPLPLHKRHRAAESELKEHLRVAQ